jgi:hypothetical protein
MADTTVRISSPTDGRILTIDLDETVTARELIDELLALGQIPSSPNGYRLGKKMGS